MRVEERGVVDQDVELAGLFDHGGDGGVDAVLLGHIHLDRIGGFADFLGCGFRRPDIDVRERDGRAFADISFGKGAADSAGGAGDEGGFSVEAFHLMLIPFSSKRWTFEGSGVR